MIIYISILIYPTQSSTGLQKGSRGYPYRFRGLWFTTPLLDLQKPEALCRDGIFIYEYYSNYAHKGVLGERVCARKRISVHSPAHLNWEYWPVLPLAEIFYGSRDVHDKLVNVRHEVSSVIYSLLYLF